MNFYVRGIGEKKGPNPVQVVFGQFLCSEIYHVIYRGHCDCSIASAGMWNLMFDGSPK